MECNALTIVATCHPYEKYIKKKNFCKERTEVVIALDKLIAKPFSFDIFAIQNFCLRPIWMGIIDEKISGEIQCI